MGRAFAQAGGLGLYSTTGEGKGSASGRIGGSSTLLITATTREPSLSVAGTLPMLTRARSLPRGRRRAGGGCWRKSLDRGHVAGQAPGWMRDDYAGLLAQPANH